MQALKNIVINGVVILSLLFGLKVPATAAGPTFEEVKALAEKGDSQAQGMLGMYYENGTSVRQDYSKAIEWYQKSANQGDIFSQFSMGYAYSKGQGVRQNHSRALEWFKKADAQNSPTAQAYIGLMYKLGEGVRQNKTTAKEWYGKSCDNGYQGGCDSYRELNEQGY